MSDISAQDYPANHDWKLLMCSGCGVAVARVWVLRDLNVPKVQLPTICSACCDRPDVQRRLESAWNGDGPRGVK